MHYRKQCALNMHQLLEALYDTADIRDAAETLNACFAAQRLAGDDISAFGDLIAATRESDMSPRARKALRAPLSAALASLLKDLQCRVFIGNDMGPRPPVKKGVPSARLNDASALPPTSDDRIHILLTAKETFVEGLEDRVDAFISMDELRRWTNICYPLDVFEYDRCYLAGKLHALSKERRDARVAIAGSSYAMTGILASLLPVPAVNLAVNAQDPYYALLSLRRAARANSGIQTIVLPTTYYFWQVDMAANASDYYMSILSRVNYPIFKDAHNAKGAISEILPVHRSPLIEHLFDLPRIRENLRQRFMEDIAPLDYYNSYNKRLPHGMLQFDFHQESDERNDKGASIRAGGHNTIYHMDHFEENMRLFLQFLREMKAAGRQVVHYIMPVTSFYRKFTDGRAKEALYSQLPALEAAGLIFFDLFESDAFDNSCFQDYDHMNDAGAKKMTAYLAERLNSL